MNLLLDTHVLLWWLDDSSALSKKTKRVVADRRNIVFVSAASIWEIQIKRALGKLEIPPDFKNVLENQAFEMLAISFDHAHKVGELPLLNRDPFDRMLVAQANVEKLCIVTHDLHIMQYRIPVLEA